MRFLSIDPMSVEVFLSTPLTQYGSYLGGLVWFGVGKLV